MNKLICLLGCILVSSFTLADDTEIYGSTAIDEANRVDSNVLFIMDTSGSMGADVDITLNPYEPSTVYTGSYYAADVYNSLNDDRSDGHNASALTSSRSDECEDVVTTLASTGKSLGTFKQYRRGGWNNLSDGNDGDIRCDQGSSGWLYTGNYMNWYHNTDNVSQSTRLQVVKDVLTELTHSLKNINLGLMRFDQSSNGGMIDVPVSSITTSGALIRSKLNDYYAQGGTPLEETMYEAARYYRGENWEFGDTSSPNPSVTASRIGASAQYDSPIDAACQKNHIILLTDGEPTNDTDANSKIRSWITGRTLPAGLSTSCSGNGECMDELAYWMRNTDHSDSEVGNQDITTYTIGGFDFDDDDPAVALLKRTAAWGGGKYFKADDTAGLTTALDSIFLDILSTDSTFTAPAVSVNAFNASEHRDDLFYALFRPDDNIKWGGNLKKYKLTGEGLVVGQNTSIPAISTTSGFFNESIYDFWNTTGYPSGTPDGKDVTLGGFANTLTNPSLRKIYSEDSANSLISMVNVATAETLNMTANTAAEVLNVKNWVLGYDVDNEDGDSTTIGRRSIGDPLHSEPVIVTYGGTDAAPDSTIYFGTNEGFIHALSTETGQEQFAFLPKELHGIQNTYYQNTAAAADKPYGMDGKITTWFKDVNDNHVLLNGGNVEAGEHVYLYAGMRRGGDNYYALDVSNRNSPRMLFKIEGGTSGFEKLGQTWSGMTVAKVKFNNAERFVLFFTGGYDTNQDSNTLSEVDSIGNAIYMVDAQTGALLWTASNTGEDLNISTMVNSMPASVAAIDITGDGFINYLFATDTGGRVFRIDLNPNNSGAGDFAQGGMIASIAGTTAETNRRFYNKPNVALVKDKQYGDYLTIAVGSGHRAHPISTTAVKNRFYVIKDFNPYRAPATYISKTEENEGKISLSNGESPDIKKLYNATSLMTDGVSALTDDMKKIMSAGGGFYVTLGAAEKVLAESTTFSGSIIFTTFSPSGRPAGNACGPDTGASRIYAISQITALATIDLDGDGDLDDSDSSTVLAHSGIAPRPVVIYRKGGGKSIAIGTEVIDDDRFQHQAPDADCAANGTCQEDAKKCETNNCYVTPVYWRQDEL